MGSTREIRMQIGAEILKEMAAEDALPQANIYKLAETMMVFFRKNHHAKSLEDHNQSWRPKKDYWRNQLPGIRSALRDERQFFEYVREEGEFKGMWKFTGKTEYQDVLGRERAGMATRTDTYNERVTDGDERWKLNLPLLAEVPKLSEN